MSTNGIVTVLSIAGTALLLVAANPAAAEQESSATVCSDLCVHAESGDLIGTRMVVMRFKEADYVLFQSAEGEVVEAPQLGKALIDTRNGDVLFRIPESEKTIATFKGKMTTQLLTGAFDNHWVSGSGQKNFRLPKIDGRQRSFPPCK